MTHRVDLESQVMKQIQDLPVADQDRVLDRIKALAEEPRPSGCEKLSGMRDAWRIRSGNYRIVYRVDDAADVVTVTRVGHRREVYRRK